MRALSPPWPCALPPAPRRRRVVTRVRPSVAAVDGAVRAVTSLSAWAVDLAACMGTTWHKYIRPTGEAQEDGARQVEKVGAPLKLLVLSLSWSLCLAYPAYVACGDGISSRTDTHESDG